MSYENIAFACLTKHTQSAENTDSRVCWLKPDLSEETLSYRAFEESSNRLAQVLQELGVNTGDVVCVYLPRSLDLVNAFFAIQKNLAVSCILFSTLGEEAIYDRMENCRAKLLITKKSLLKKVLTIRAQLPDLRHILLVDGDKDDADDILSLPTRMAEAPAEFDYPHFVDPETPSFLQYTSGSTGKPKGALHVHGALADMLSSFAEVMQPEEQDIYWCTADPAWITGLVYGIIVPFATGIRQVQFEGTYRADRWLALLAQQQVSLWYTAPTALRMLMQEEIDWAVVDLPALKRLYSVGEPLNPEIYTWGKRAFRREIYDTWFQSETGCIMVANRPGLPVKPGSMAVPRAGVEVVITDEAMQPLPAGEQGHLCLRKGWGSMFRTYYRREDAYQSKFRGELYVTGDVAYKDADGYVWYVSRSDDVINTAGHLVGPFEVESALLEIPEIVDVAVIGAADPILHEKIVAYLTLRKGVEWSRELELKCRVHVANAVSTSAIPAEYHLIAKVPKNQSGKILRRVLKAMYEGKDPGDLSTME
ncbi:MAG TPA: AMP-binding protein [Anaerolineaceae bacterium]|nr:AMP-binding protein [Anaerolineaceae bacterium]